MDSKKSGWIFFLMVVLNVGASLLLSIQEVHVWIDTMGILIISEMIIVIPCFILYLLSKEKIVNTFGIHKIRMGTVFLSAFYAMMLAPLVATLNAVSLFFTDNAAQVIFESMDGLPFWVTALFIAVIAPVCEEFAFRGILYRGFRKNGSAFQAIILTSLLFGLFHMNVNQMIYAFALGIFFALLREATGSVWPSVIGHMTINGGSTLLTGLEPGIAPDAAKTVQEVTTGMIINTACVLGFVALFTTAIAIAILNWIAKREYGEGALKAVFTQRKKTHGRVWSLALICAMLACVFLICYKGI